MTIFHKFCHYLSDSISVLCDCKTGYWPNANHYESIWRDDETGIPNHSQWSTRQLNLRRWLFWGFYNFLRCLSVHWFISFRTVFLFWHFLSFACTDLVVSLLDWTTIANSVFGCQNKCMVRLTDSCNRIEGPDNIALLVNYFETKSIRCSAIKVPSCIKLTKYYTLSLRP